MKESSDRVFIQDPPWISSLLMKSLLFRSKNSNGVKIEFQEMERRKYYLLRRRQVKAETEAWENMVEEYRELEREMCERKLAPNLPYFKKLMLGWFQPLREAIEKEQNKVRSKKNKAAFAPFIDALPADKIAVIVMHKMMGLMMMGGKEDRWVRVVEAASKIGIAIENEVSIHHCTCPCFLMFGIFLIYYYSSDIWNLCNRLLVVRLEFTTSWRRRKIIGIRKVKSKIKKNQARML